MSDVVTELRKVAATLTRPAQVHTLLYAADLLVQALTERDRTRLQLADAPHGTDCWAYSAKTGLPEYPGDCNCWKEGL